MKDIKEFLLEVLSDCAVSSADSEYIVRLIAAYTEGQEPVKGIDYDEAMDRYYIPVHPNWEVQTKGKGSTFRIARIDTGERHLVLDKHLHRMLEDMARDINARFTAPPEPAPNMADMTKRIATLEQQNAELVAALELCKKHMAGDKLDPLFIDGALSKVKQP